MPKLIPKHLAKDEFARRLLTLMRRKGWRQAEFARQAGLARNAISVYLRGSSLPNPESLQKLAKALGVKPEELLPNYQEAAIERDHPELELRVSPGDSKTAWIRINRAMPTTLAIKIMGLIEAHDTKTDE
ncbi:Helix-turn-helix [Rhodopseudomonas pseudopalustris]|uniref:Helix-turn-helix n=2 Tax=Rhodopseudomonas pseudopalustris TaxID=1513892 RepID=A0A1H8WGT1_9BRAD|nr:Helix-turn-helix [Rhodopseudomonas pseudopalustris]